MTNIGLVSCVGAKRTGRVPAADLYTSPWFRKAKQYVTTRCERWYILSAKYGLLCPDELVEPYERTLNNMPQVERRAWASTVSDRLRALLGHDDRLTILAGVRYREFLLPLLSEGGHKIVVPMEGLTIGRQLNWLDQQLRR